MALSISDHCRSCIISLQEIISILSQPDRSDNHVKPSQVCEELNRFGLFIGNIGALHRPESPLSIESRLQDAKDVLIHILGLLADLNDVTAELLAIVSGEREGMVTITDEAEEEGEVISEANGLREEISETITRLFRVTILIRQAAPIDIFAKALSRNRYHFSDQFDIAHVGEKYRKLATEDYAWLRQRLGRAITQRRHYLNYIHDHHESLGGTLDHHDKADSSVAKSQALVIKQPLDPKPMLDSESRPSFFTKATTIAAERITPQLHVAVDSDPDEDSPHLEQLALFAVPIAAATDDNDDSNAAIEEAGSKRTNTSQASALTFPSSQGDFDDLSSETETNKSRNIISRADTKGNEIHREDVIKGTPSLSSDSGEKRDQDSSVKTPIKLDQVSQLQNIVKANMKTLGHDHTDTLTSMVNLASTYINQGRWEDAEKLEVQVMETRKRKLGADHPDTLTSMANLASTYREQGRWGEAEMLQVQVMETSKTKLGADHPDTLSSMNNLAYTQKSLGREVEAIELMRECVQLRQQRFRPDHPDLVSSLATLAQWKAEHAVANSEIV
ncbi:unnamed protein product [Alternaria alternata]